MTDIGALLRLSVEQMARYVVLPAEAEATALALFVAHTYALEGAHATPYLLITSPERESGKTRLLENLELQVAQPWRVTGASEAAMFRKIQAEKPTLMLDEIDATFGTYTERTEGLRQILNAGNRPGACVSRCVGEKHQVHDYSVYCPKVLAGIDTGKKIPETIRGRAIEIRMVRKTAGEKVEQFRHRFAKQECKSLREGFERWALDACELLIEAVPDVPEELGDRAGEGWEALFAIADMAGAEWPQKARRAAVELSAPKEDSDRTYGQQLLEAVRTAMGVEDRITTAALLEAVNGEDELPFGSWRDGKGLDARGIAKILSKYGIRPRSIRVEDGTTPKGYLREQMLDAWERWLAPASKRPPQAPHPPLPLQSATDVSLETGDVADVADVAGAPEKVADAERIAAEMGVEV
ncbi:MAG: DUF3631 domain-containing protein [Solirubrobacterales bacterium]